MAETELLWLDIYFWLKHNGAAFFLKTNNEQHKTEHGVTSTVKLFIIAARNEGRVLIGLHFYIHWRQE